MSIKNFVGLCGIIKFSMTELKRSEKVFFAKALLEELRLIHETEGKFDLSLLESYSPYVWNSNLTRTQKWLLQILFTLSSKGQFPIYISAHYLKEVYGIKAASVFMSLLKRKGYIARYKGMVYFPHILREEDIDIHWFWKAKLTYSQLGFLYFLFSHYSKHIKEGQHLYHSAGVYKKLSTYWKMDFRLYREKFLDNIKKYERLGILSKTQHPAFRLFKLKLIRKLPFNLNDVPKPDGTLSIEEYALYVDMFLNKLPDNSIHMRAIPKRRASKEKLKTLLESLIEKGKLTKVVSNTFLVNYNH